MSRESLCCFISTLVANIMLATSCPTWHYNVTGVCECGYGLHCSSDGNQVEIDTSRCATSSGKEGDYYIGHCPFRYITNSTNRMHSEMPSNTSQLDEAMCGPYNRRGLLCGECKDGYGPAVYSFGLNCANCSSLWSGYAISLYLLQFVPTTLIYISLAILRLKLTSGPLLGYMLFCQFNLMSLGDRSYFLYGYIESSVTESLGILLTFSVTMSEFSNLQFLKTILPPYCISDKLTGIQVHMLNLLPATYPFVLVIISCILMELHARKVKIVDLLFKPFKIISSTANITAVTGDAFFQAFASLIFLSNISVLSALLKSISTTNVYTSTGILQRNTLYVDPTVEWPSHKGFIYLSIATLVCLSTLLIPSILLCIYPTRVYRYLSRFLSARKRLAITAFAEALHSCFKDGLNGTRDYRALAGAPIFLTLSGGAVNWLLSSLTDFMTRDIVTILLWMMFVCLVSYVKPCKSAIANVSLSFHMALLGIFIAVQYLWWNDPYVGSTYTLELTFIATLLTPHILVALWAGYTLTKYTLTKCGYQFHGPGGCKIALSDMANGVRLCLYRGHRGYQELQ